MFIFLFVDPALGVKKLFEKEGTVEKCGISFEIKDWVICLILIEGVEQNFTQSLPTFL